MINRLLLGACVAILAIGLSAPFVVSSRGEAAERRPGEGVAAATNTDTKERRHGVPEDMKERRHGVPEDTKERRQGVPVDRVIDARPGESQDETGFLGVVVALQSVELSARFDGTLERLDVHVGDHVTAGTSIGRLDSRSIAQDLAIAEAALRVADAEHDRMAVELEEAASRRARLQRIPDLVARDQISAAESQEDVAAARLRGAAAERTARRARADQLRDMLRDAHIVAPFDGTIASRYVDAGATVSRSTPIVRIISPRSLAVRFAVPEEQAAGLAVGVNVIVRVGSVNRAATGVIERIVPEIDAALRMVVFEARLAAHGGRTDTIQAGASVRVVVGADSNDRARAVPIEHSPTGAGDTGSGHERSTH